MLKSLEHYHPITTKVIPTPTEQPKSETPIPEAVNSIVEDNEPSAQGDRISEGVPVVEPSVDIDIMSETG